MKDVTLGRQRPMVVGPVLAAVDAISTACMWLGYGLVIAITCALFYEVVARYVFLAPTMWAQDLSITAQIWFTYLGMAYVLRRREMIRITAVAALLGPTGRRIVEAFALLSILAFSLMAVYFAWGVIADSLRLGRRQPTMLELPNWIAEIPVLLGFALLALQALAELIRLPFQPAPDFSPGGEHAVEEEPGK
ncbi:TRAP transporter small permease [Telmatospirillum sp. J64-1]|uniref:TRAP transporter small permease n=1 Tax=Telmatospirillum sp. J64-1 TaxID=2502183 RepID=UPI00115D5600|nr:TRAP transporter small permease subunit [Telmatospirillum sp. J64-1]